jgi:hypothetical protein
MIADLLAGLRMAPGHDASFNPWLDYDPDLDCGPEAPSLRAGQLRDYLEARLGRVRLIACAEATGYQGGRFTGIPMTSERILLGRCEGTESEDVLRNGVFHRTSRPDMPGHPRVSSLSRLYGFAEPTASCVWRTIHESGIDPYAVLLWNTYPFHAHMPGNSLSNRRLFRPDIELGRPFIGKILKMYPGATVAAIGNCADSALSTMGVPHVKLRHPSQGGATQFKREFLKVLGCL